jgi:hypothetical protein
MPSEIRHVLTLELEFVGDDVSGRLSDRAGDGREFVGWLGLAGAIELLAPSAPTPTNLTPSTRTQETLCPPPR